MSTRLAVDDHNELREITVPEVPKQPGVLRFAAKIISYVFHPVFIPVYVAWFLINIQPYLFAGFNAMEKTLMLIRFITVYAFFPLISVLLLKALGFISSTYLKTQRDRIIPYIICMIYYFSLWFFMRRQPENPPAIISFTLAIFIASIGGLMANIYLKVSMHAISVGVVAAFMLTLAFSQEINFGVYLTITFLITGLVCTARLIVSDHTPKEIYIGLLIGIASQLLANWVG
ncbi:MAG TPA: hypothetical protein VET23_11125 [Chitinophagaceae bacterium]|nr:hypothetical protein [Chitinophagaceae bacterium]